MTLKRQRMLFVLVGVVALSAATILVLFAMEDAITFFRSPTQVVEKDFPNDRIFRLGGLVEQDSVKNIREDYISFRITDLVNSIIVNYTGILPALFREGQGVIAEGELDANGIFIATNILAKHDETYMPSEVVDALKAAGQWQGN